MKITNISCSQFAGIKDRSISFEDGINVVYGKNESGKSTLVNLISRTLFQDAKTDGRKDKAFKNDCFPSDRRDKGITGDFIDGNITFETENGVYSLSKEWGKDGSCRLTAPFGRIKNQKEISAILNEELRYGEGVYSEILFSSQIGADNSLKTVLDSSQKTDAKKEIVDVASKAFLEAGGVSVDAIGEAIDEKIADIEGKHWNRSIDRPESKRGNGLWASGLGEIHKAFNKMKEAEEVLDKVNKLRNEADDKAFQLKEAEKNVKEAEEKQLSFNKYFEALSRRTGYKKELERISRELRTYESVVIEWPQKKELLEKAQKLLAEQRERNILDKYHEAKKIVDVNDSLKRKRSDRACPTNAEIKNAKSAERKISVNENKLCGMNLNAAVKMFGGNSVVIKSVLTGEIIDITDGRASLTEAVRVIIPDVFEMELSPANVKAEDIKQIIESENAQLTAVLDKYAVDSIEKLEGLAKELRDIDAEIEKNETKLETKLGAETYEELKAKKELISETVRSAQEISADIRSLDAKMDLSQFIVKTETIINGYVSQYGGISELKQMISDHKKRKDELERSLLAADDIPAEYAAITNPEDHRAKLSSRVKECSSKKDEAIRERSHAFAKLEDYSLPDLESEYEEAERKFEEQKTLLHHWLHIKSVYEQIKQNINNDPLADIGQSFARYLGIISAGRVVSEMSDSGKLDMRIYSNDNLIDYLKLSEGTKETVSLAFRLAVLDHLFPNGGGVIVFDDPFANMDSERTQQSCELIKECAKKHQVIFMTCSEEYIDMLGGNGISLEKSI